MSKSTRELHQLIARLLDYSLSDILDSEGEFTFKFLTDTEKEIIGDQQTFDEVLDWVEQNR